MPRFFGHKRTPQAADRPSSLRGLHSRETRGAEMPLWGAAEGRKRHTFPTGSGEPGGRQGCFQWHHRSSICSGHRMRTTKCDRRYHVLQLRSGTWQVSARLEGTGISGTAGTELKSPGPRAHGTPLPLPQPEPHRPTVSGSRDQPLAALTGVRQLLRE